MNPYIRLPKVQVVNGRQELIVNRCRDKKVLHLGCVDVGLLSERFPSGGLLHQQLAAVAGELWGVDIDTDGVSFLRSQGFNNLVVGDICKLDEIEDLKGKHFDIIIASEVIEHLQNPGQFLNEVKTFMRSGKTELIVTLPNAFRIDTLIWLLRGVEYIHPDHNYWFSYHTATNLIRKGGLEIDEVYVYSFQPIGILPKKVRNFFNKKKENGLETIKLETATTPSWSVPFLKRASAYFWSLPKRLVVSFLYRRTPFWADGIIIVAKAAHNVV
jgi:SAM-dependent methyltransferase